jgi:plastocyanin
MSMLRRTSLTALLVAAIVAAGRAEAGPVTGIVKTAVKAGATAAQAIVYAEPLDGAAPSRPDKAAMVQKGRSFQPAVLAVPAGSTVDFPNKDVVFHNIFSLSTPEPFDLGLYRAGESKTRLFTRPGLYRVFCNIHPEMNAFIAVVPTPYVTIADAQGRFRLDLPPGRYKLTALSSRAAAQSAEVTATGGSVDAPALALDESQFVSLPHKNKFGQDYPATAYKQ